MRQGALEGSGVDAAKVMVEMITSLRSFQSGQQAIQAIGQTLQEAASQVGSLDRFRLASQGSSPLRARPITGWTNASEPGDWTAMRKARLANRPRTQDRLMLEGLYSAAAGMSAQQEQLDAIGNDLANLSTDGYKSERVAFSDLLYNPVDIAGTDTTTGAGASAQVIGRSETQGSIQETGDPLDWRSKATATSRSSAPTARSGSPATAASASTRAATIVNSEGNRLEPPIKLPAGVSPSEVRSPPTAPSRAGNASSARSSSSRSPRPTICSPTAAAGSRRRPPAAPSTRRQRASIHQGALEGSNVDIARDMAHDGQHPARLSDDQHRDPDREPDDVDRQPAARRAHERPDAAAAPGLPAVNQALEPAWVRHGSAATQKAYETALAFEQMLVEQLSKSLTATSGLGGESSGKANRLRRKRRIRR